MYIESLQLKNFRNYQSLDLTFDQGTNILYGENAQGKTNILEAVYMCGTTKSHRGSKDREVIQFHQDESHICMKLVKNGLPYKLDMHLKKNKPKGAAINGIPIHKVSELFGVVNLVFFSPEDLNLIKNGPSERRKFLDLELCQLDKIYLSDLFNFQKVINQRNKLLRDIAFQPKLEETIDIWDYQLLTYGKRIIAKRKEFIWQLNEIIQEIHQNLTGKKEKMELKYEANVSEELYEETLAANRDRDLKLHTTCTGPHRDDLCVKINGFDIRKYGSQGQQRTAALSLKLSEIYMVKNTVRDTPVLLLDDVLSELDHNRQNYLLNSIHQIQTLITCTGLDDFVNSRFRINKIFQVTAGSIRQG